MKSILAHCVRPVIRNLLALGAPSIARDTIEPISIEIFPFSSISFCFLREISCSVKTRHEAS